jgi:inhibitor of KinA
VTRRSTGSPPTYLPVADHAVLVSFDGEVDGETLARVHALDAALAAAPPDGVTETVPALTSLLVCFDPLHTDHDAVTAAVGEMVVTAEPRPAVGVTHHVIDVCYDGEHAPDLGAVQARTGLAGEAVIAAHVQGAFTVGMFGFAPGFAYLYGTPADIQVPRNPTPGVTVAAGSVLIAGAMCLITPVAMSTGWFAIGRTATPMLRAEGPRPFRFDVCDTVAFRRIGTRELARQMAAHEAEQR